MRPLDPLVTPPASPEVTGPAIDPLGCPYCGQPTVLWQEVRVVQPEFTEPGAALTQEQRQAHVEGSKICHILHCLTCGADWQLIIWQAPQQSCHLVLATLAGRVLEKRELAAARASNQAKARILVPGRGM